MGRISISRGVLRLGCFTVAFVLIYMFILDPLLRPPIPTLSAFDFQAAEAGLPPYTNPNPNGTHILLVSAMFPLAKSKHTKDEYAAWLGRFLGTMTTHIYMFTTPELAETLKGIRGALPITIDTSYGSPFEVPVLRGMEGVYEKMNDMDREKWHHSPGLYAVWNAKPFFLERAVREMAGEGREFEYAFWNDGGSFRRNHRYGRWPDPDRVEQVFEEGSGLTGEKKEELLFFPVLELPDEKYRDWKEEDGPIDNSHQFSEGSFFGGSPSTIQWFSKIFYAYHNYYITKGLFVGIDQDIFNSLFLLFPERIFTVYMNDPLAPAHNGIIPSPSLVPSLERGFLGECGAEWFYYQFWLADQQTRDRMREIWIKEERWRKSGWWVERKLCRVTRAMAMGDFLRRSLGEDWMPPRRSVAIPDLNLNSR